jgi:hypothetical protein
MKSIILAGNMKSVDFDSTFLGRLENQITKLSKFSHVIVLSNLLARANFHQVPNDAQFIRIPEGTSGALATAGFGLSMLSDNEPFLIIPSNAEVAGDIAERFFESMFNSNAAVGAIVFSGTEPMYSYARLNHSGEVMEVVEKQVSGSCALAGIYYFSNRESLSNCLEWAMVNNIQNQGIFFISPALNYFVAKSIEISLFEIPSQEYLRY